ncbi:cytochrome P450 94B3-like [Aristolochia californica]|uniref:cytochrome P450 94B3-like n=1 Tax=Aristolochia californica TaxID=171875 RepID=UPI0035E2CF68
MTFFFLQLLLPVALSFSFIFFSVYLLVLGFQYYRQYSGQNPPTYPLLGCLISFCKNMHRLLDWYTDLLAKSPTQTVTIARFGATRTIVTANPENVEYILKTRFDNFPKGKPFTEILGDFLGRGIFNVDGEEWYTQRKLASHVFSTRSLREYVAITLETEVNRRLLPLLERVCLDEGVVDLQDLLRRFALDTVCLVSLGKDPACLHPSFPASPLASAFDVASEISARRAAAPVYALWKAKRVLGIGSEKRLREAIDQVHDSVIKLIRFRKAERDDKREDKDLLSRLISGGHDEEVIRDMVISFIMAGRDTTSAALTWFFWLISCLPDIEKQIVKELAETTVAPTEEGSLDYDGLKEMTTLEACLCESMRLYPPVAWDSKHAMSHDRLPDGTIVAKGDRVTYFPYGMGRMERLWGKDWKEFKPTRWLESPEGGVSRVSPYKFPVFQAGPRVCLGKEMAFVQMKYVAASVLRKFEIRLISPRQPVFVPLLTAYMAGGLKVRIYKRGKDKEI